MPRWPNLPGQGSAPKVVDRLLDLILRCHDERPVSRHRLPDRLGSQQQQAHRLGGQVVLGLVIFDIGLFFANLAEGAVRSSGATQSNLLALTARISIIVLAGAMALRQMGLANEIINLVFGLLLGAGAVAAALAFGLGGRDVAGRTIEDWAKSLKG